jgi:hypothetical protein
MSFGGLDHDVVPGQAGECAVSRYAAHGLDSHKLLPRALFHARLRALEDLSYGIREDQPASEIPSGKRAVARSVATT